MKIKKRTGLLGGTFNPVHNGHIDLGKRVLDHFSLDSIRYILSAKPPHKNGESIVAANLRWKMLTAELSKHKMLIPDDIELKRDEYSWTIDTIKQLKINFPDDNFFFISGSEGFLKITTWKDYKKLLKLINFIIVMRTEEQEETVTKLLKNECLIPSISYELKNTTPSIYYFSYKSKYLGLSSTRIRELAGSGGIITGLVGNEVEEIIEENNLYGKKQF